MSEDKKEGIDPKGFELGQLIGKQTKSFGIKNDAKESVNLTVTFDFSTTPNHEVIDLILAKTVVKFQNNGGRRQLTRAGLLELDGITVMATDAGKKVKTREEQIMTIANTFMATGIPEEKARKLAEVMVDSPEILNDLV